MHNKKRILVCGLVRDVQNSIVQEIERLSDALEDFYEICFHLIESDSKDCTLDKLEQLRNSNMNLTYTALGELDTIIPNRVERIRYCRNKYIEYIRENFENFDYVLIADFDGINSKISKSAVESIFASNIKWDMCAANQTGGYYDIYALRAKGWCESDFLIEIKEKSSSLNTRQIFKLKTELIYDRMKKISRNSPWIAVDSAFGGFAIYKKEVFLKADYSPLQEKSSRQCEHVDFNLKLRRMGYQLFINPALINSNWNTYNINKFTVVRKIRAIKREVTEALSFFWRRRTYDGVD